MNQSTQISNNADSSETRRQLLAAARKLFARRGFDGASVRAITGEAGANLGAITYHFGSKRHLYTAVLEDGLRPIAASVSAAVASEGSALDRMLRVVEVYFEHLADQPELPHLLMQEIAAGKKPPEVVVEILRGVKDAIASLQSEGIADGSVRPGHPTLTAVSVVSQPIYLTLVAPMLREVGGIDLGHAPTRRAVIEHTQAFVRAGLEPREEAHS